MVPADVPTADVHVIHARTQRFWGSRVSFPNSLFGLRAPERLCGITGTFLAATRAEHPTVREAVAICGSLEDRDPSCSWRVADRRIPFVIVAEQDKRVTESSVRERGTGGSGCQMECWRGFASQTVRKVNGLPDAAAACCLRHPEARLDTRRQRSTRSASKVMRVFSFLHLISNGQTFNLKDGSDAQRLFLAGDSLTEDFVFLGVGCPPWRAVLSANLSAAR